jgi:hypothetical protein
MTALYFNGGLQHYWSNLEKSIYPRKTQKARKYSRRDQTVNGYRKSGKPGNTLFI